MKVIVGKLAGFCGGVDYAVKGAEKEVNEKNENEKIYCLGELVHNKQVVGRLEEKGMITINNISEAEERSKVIIRAHGVPKAVYEEAKRKNITLIDLTCPNVLKIHKDIERESQDSFIILIGDKNHAEVIGSESFAQNGVYVIQDENDIIDAYKEYEKNMIGRVKIFAQTTFKESKFEELVEEIENNFVEADVDVFNTICSATHLRQEEMINMAKDLDNMIIIGGRNSANTLKLVEISSNYCDNVYHIETREDLKNIDLSKVDKIGIMAGASTPKDIIEDIKNYLEGK